jgi:hypothetical protein
MRDQVVARSLHDVGLAGWFGGVLMGATAVNRAAGDAHDPVERSRFTNGVWRRWWIVNAGCMAAHIVGGTLLTAGNASRLSVQRPARRAARIKGVLTLAAVAASAYSGVIGKRLSDAGDFAISDGTTPSSDTPSDLAQDLERERVLQWLIPALTGAMLVLSAEQGEQQRPARLLHDLTHRRRR